MDTITIIISNEKTTYKCLDCCSKELVICGLAFKRKVRSSFVELAEIFVFSFLSQDFYAPYLTMDLNRWKSILLLKSWPECYWEQLEIWVLVFTRKLHRSFNWERILCMLFYHGFKLEVFRSANVMSYFSNQVVWWCLHTLGSFFGCVETYSLFSFLDIEAGTFHQYFVRKICGRFYAIIFTW